MAASAPLGSDPAAVALLVQLGRALYLRDEPARTIEVLDRALDVAERLDLVDLVAEALSTRGGALSDLGRTYEGLAAVEGALRLATDRGLTTIALRAQNTLGAYLSHRDPRKSLEVLRSAMVEARRLGARAMLLRLTSNATEAARETGDWVWAIAEIDSQLATDLDREDRVQFLGQRVWFSAFLGASSEVSLAELRTIVGEDTDPNVRGSAEEAEGVVALVQGRHGDARDHFRRSADLSQLNAPTALAWAGRAAAQMGDSAGVLAQLEALRANPAHGPAITARRQALDAAAAALGGEPDLARAGLRSAAAAWDALGSPWEQALAVMDAAILLGPDDPFVLEAGPGARDIFVRLGARAALDELERALMATPPAVAR